MSILNIISKKIFDMTDKTWDFILVEKVAIQFEMFSNEASATERERERGAGCLYLQRPSDYIKSNIISELHFYPISEVDQWNLIKLLHHLILSSTGSCQRLLTSGHRPCRAHWPADSCRPSPSAGAHSSCCSC